MTVREGYRALNFLRTEMFPSSFSTGTNHLSRLAHLLNYNRRPPLQRLRRRERKINKKKLNRRKLITLRAQGYYDILKLLNAFVCKYMLYYAPWLILGDSNKRWMWQSIYTYKNVSTFFNARSYFNQTRTHFTYKLWE